jgi:hypothetical protein
MDSLKKPSELALGELAQQMGREISADEAESLRRAYDAIAGEVAAPDPSADERYAVALRVLKEEVGVDPVPTLFATSGIEDTFEQLLRRGGVRAPSAPSTDASRASDDPAEWERWLLTHHAFDGTIAEFLARVEAARGEASLDESLCALKHRGEQALCRGFLDLPAGPARANAVARAWVHLAAMLAAGAELWGMRRELAEAAIRKITMAVETSARGATETAERYVSALVSAHEREVLAWAETLAAYLEQYAARSGKPSPLRSAKMAVPAHPVRDSGGVVQAVMDDGHAGPVVVDEAAPPVGQTSEVPAEVGLPAADDMEIIGTEPTAPVAQTFPDVGLEPTLPSIPLPSISVSFKK